MAEKTAVKVHIKNARLAFPDLFVARENVGDDGKVRKSFGCKLLLPPGHPAIEEIRRAMGAVAKKKWGEKAADVFKLLIANHKVCLQDGNLKEWDGFAGNMFLSAGGTVRPTVVDHDRSPLTQADGRPYAGCFVNALVEIWPQENKHGKRINAQLKGVQWLRDGDAFGGGAPASPDEFDDVSSEGADGEAPDAAGGDEDWSKYV